MTARESHTSQLSFFGRIADDLTRKVILPPDLNAVLEASGKPSLNKRDGYFVFADLPPSATEYRIQIDANAFQRRTIAKVLPAAAAVEITLPGEDELYLSISDIAISQAQVAFEPITFLPPIEAGAAIFGQSGFRATLTEPLDGSKVSFAKLSSVAGLAANQLLRIVRSRNLLVRPGPYYEFPADVTVVAFNVTDSDQGGSAIVGARIDISKINNTAPSSVSVGDLNLDVFDLGGAVRSMLLFDEDDRTTVTNERGDAVFYFPGGKPIASIEVQVTEPGFQPTSQTLNVTVKARNAQKIVLSKV
jgi:hypothetical protein